MSKKQMFITDLLYWDANKFKTHLEKRKKENLVEDKEEYVEVILDILMNYERLFITEDSYREKFLLLRLEDWLLIFDESYKISTTFKINKNRYEKIEDLLEDMKSINKIKKYMEVKDERSIYKRIIKRLQDRT